MCLSRAGSLGRGGVVECVWVPSKYGLGVFRIRVKYGRAYFGFTGLDQPNGFRVPFRELFYFSFVKIKNLHIIS